MENNFSPTVVGGEGAETSLYSYQDPVTSFAAQDPHMSTINDVEDNSGSEEKSEEDFDPDNDEEVDEEEEFGEEDSYSDEDNKPKKGNFAL